MGRELRVPQAAVVTYRKATTQDAEYLGPRLRDADQIEINLMYQEDPTKVLKDSLRQSIAFVACLEEEPIAVFGVADMGQWGSPWLVGTEGMSRHGRDLVGVGRQFVQAWLNTWPGLYNFVHDEHVVAKRWLKHLGFTIHAARPTGAQGAPFCLFQQFRTQQSCVLPH